eukprot:gnl/TRDRNA2_/TRDRNA2_204126_c0_seq1.p1 gnl/TRDRNA2_/TRDRNA2_204126_c0~~gnl/TRDRNA2_/TRDRNA2_204126_c0_seq1.p1  ORF type:complete len:194 (-),score=21.66 gnl/TRDRNA2_/TRDRNA2_204126_c0_seq1:335-916(-)
MGTSGDLGAAPAEAIDLVTVTIRTMSGDVAYGPSLQSRSIPVHDLLHGLAVPEGSEPELLHGTCPLEDLQVALASLLGPEETELDFSVIWAVEKVPSTLFVSGAGLEACNGIYGRADEEKRGRPMWKNADTGSWIEWWGNGCGWEMYHARSGTCDYWTQQDDHDEGSPAERIFKVRGAPEPAPTVSRKAIPAS